MPWVTKCIKTIEDPQDWHDLSTVLIFKFLSLVRKFVALIFFASVQMKIYHSQTPQCMCIKIVYLSQLDRSFFILWFAFLFAASFIINITCLLSAPLVISIWILNLYYHSADKPVPKWIKWLVLEWLATTVCLKCRCPVSKVSAANSGSPDTRIVMGSVASINVNEDFSSRKKTGKEIIQPGYVCAFIPRSVEKEEAAAISDQNKSDWQSLARVLDRFFLGISLVAIIIITVMTYTAYNWND